MAPINPWRPEWQYRRFDRWKNLKKDRCAWRPLRYGKRYMTSTGLSRILRHYGFELQHHPVQAHALLVVPREPVSQERLKRFAAHIERTPALKALRRVARGIQRTYGLPDRTRYKQS